MKLRYSPTSPYVRKVTVTAGETGLSGRMERIPTNPWDAGSDLPRDNPLGRVPALLLDDGTVLYDSPVICEYLDSLHQGHRLFPTAGSPRWTALRHQALADGVLDAAVTVFIERRRRPEALRWPDWEQFQLQAVERSLDAMEGEGAFGDAPPCIGQVAMGCALGYLDFRFPELDWRSGRPGLAQWYQVFGSRPSMSDTVPSEPA